MSTLSMQPKNYILAGVCTVVGLAVYQLCLLHKLQNRHSSQTPQDHVGEAHTIRASGRGVATISEAGQPERRRVLVATRVHQANAQRLVDLEKLEAFVVQALSWGEDVGVAVAVGAQGDLGLELLRGVEALVSKILASDTWSGRHVEVVAVTPWGKFVAGLNALVQHSLDHHFDHILFSSVETVVAREGIEALRSQMHTNDLVVGAAFGDHKFNPGQASGGRGLWHALDGATTPWNTLALWHAPTLALVGFLGVAEGLDVESGRSDGGVEEVTAIAVLQHLLAPPLPTQARESSIQMGPSPATPQAESATIPSPSTSPYPPRLGCKLVRIPGLKWAVANFAGDPERQKWHERKMASKASRPAAQLARFSNLPHGRVLHLDLLT